MINKIEPYYMQDIKQRQMDMFRKFQPSIHLELTRRQPNFKQGETIRDFISPQKIR